VLKLKHEQRNLSSTGRLGIEGVVQFMGDETGACETKVDVVGGGWLPISPQWNSVPVKATRATLGTGYYLPRHR